MRRTLFVCLLLVGCGSPNDVGAAEKARRAQVLAAAFFNTTANSAGINGIGCHTDAPPGELIGIVTAYKAQHVTADRAVKVTVASELAVCPRNQWGRIAAVYADAGLADRTVIDQVVTRGIAALGSP